DDDDRHELLRKVSFEEPALLRRINPAIPRELETIVLKAIAKEPGARYATCRELADDLRRFLELKPIPARPPAPLELPPKWSRRHSSLVLATLVMLGLISIGLVIGSWLIWKEKERTRAAYSRELVLRTEADDQRNRAVKGEQDVRRYLYLAQMNLAQQAHANG